MNMARCMWCESEIRVSSKVCPECSLENPISAHTQLGAATPSRRRKAAKRGGRRVLLALLAAPLMLSFAYAAHSKILPIAGDASVAGTAVTPLPATVTDPVQRGVWLNGMRAVRLALAEPDFAAFQQTYIRQSAGQLVSLCGTIPGGQLSGIRFVSMGGDTARTVVEGRDPSFETLWTRLCNTSDTV